MYAQPATATHHRQCQTFSVPSAAASVPLVPQGAGNRIASLMGDDAITHRRMKAGEYLFHSGDAFQNFYVLNAGFAKTCQVSEDGREQITGIYLRGDMLGLDAVAAGKYACDAQVLDVTDVLVIPYSALMAECQKNPALLHEMHSAFSSELCSDRDQLINIGSLTADGRVAAFLLEMSRRFGSRGFSATQLQLRLTRQEIGSLLGLKLETVSRAFSRFARLGFITVNLRQVGILDLGGLRETVAFSHHAGTA